MKEIKAELKTDKQGYDLYLLIVNTLTQHPEYKEWKRWGSIDSREVGHLDLNQDEFNNLCSNPKFNQLQN